MVVQFVRRWHTSIMGALRTISGSEQTPGTVSELAYSRLRADILFGRLAPRERLPLDAVGQRYGASVSTMRELLSRLASEGLVVAEGQRGFEVAPVSPAEFREVGALRLLLETHAMAQSFAAGDLEWEGQVVAAHHKLSVMESRMIDKAEADPILWKQCDRSFHHALIAACGSRMLLTTHSAVYDKYLRYQMIAVVFRGEAAAREHGELLDCALKRNSARATSILQKHIESCLDYALSDLSPNWAVAPTPSATSVVLGVGKAGSPRGSRVAAGKRQ